MPVQQIPLDGGLITQVEPEEVGLAGCTELIDCEFDKPGLIYKRTGRGATTSISANVGEIIRWIAPNGTAYWVVFDSSDGKVYIAEDLTSLGDEIFDSTATYANIQNYGSMLRFANGVGFESKVYQYINRDFFWYNSSPDYGYDYTPAFHIDKATPQAIAYDLVQCGKLSTEYQTSMGHQTKTYQYRITFVYDGNQETELPKLSIVSSEMALDASVVSLDTDVFFFNLRFDQTVWNPRCTGINIYRKEGSGAFYKVLSANTLSRDSDLNLQVADANGFVTKVIVDTSNGLTSAINTKKLYLNGFTHTIASEQNAQFASMDDEIDSNIGNTWGTIPGTDDLVFNNNTGTTDSNDIGAWFIGEDVTNGTSGIKDNNGSTYNHANWDDQGSATFTIASSATEQLFGNNSLRFYSGFLTGSAEEVAFDLGFTGLTSTDSIVVQFWFKMTGIFTGNETAVVGINDVGAGGGADVLVMAHRASGATVGGATPAEVGAGDKWRFVNKKIVLSSIAGYTNGDNLYLTVSIDGEVGDPPYLYINNLVVAQNIYCPSSGYIAYGSDVVASESFDLGVEDSAQGWVTQIGGSSAGAQAVKNNYQYAFRNSGSGLAVSTTQTVHINRSYGWQDEGTTHRFSYRDLDDTDGIVHPTGETSLDVNFTYSVNLDGRQYVAGVALNPSAENEIHNDWVMFSELSQPDVIPITNYIAIPDLQGGEIKGLAKLIGDLVVFQTKGIYRISTPSANPLSWSLSESEPNIGCIAPDSIVEHDAGVFFAGSDHIYHLGSNFQAIPVTQTIKDVYQGTANLDQTRLTVDVKKNRLLCRFGSVVNTTYVLDLTQIKQGREHWSKMDMAFGAGDAHHLVVDENLVVYSIDAGATSYMRTLDAGGSETTALKRTTGWIPMGDLDRSGVLRRLNMRYKSADTITAKIYTDGDASTVDKTITIPANNSADDDWYKCKPNVRCRNFMIELSTSHTQTAVEIRRMEVEIG